MPLMRIALDTLDKRCPDVMLDVRLLFKTPTWSSTDDALIHITTREPASLRDIPAYCTLKGYHLLSVDTENHEHRFVVSPTLRSIPLDVIHAGNTRLHTVTLHGDERKKQRDHELHASFEHLVLEFIHLIQRGFTLVFPCSFGKDSTVVINAGLEAYRRLIHQPNSGFAAQTPFIVIHIDTSIEVIPMDMYSHYAMEQLQTYCIAHQINLELHHEQPPLYEQFVSLFVGARKLPSTPNLNSDCAVIWKVDASESIQRHLIRTYGVEKVVSCIGSRVDEGAQRAASLVKHGNMERTAEHLIRHNEHGLQTFAPIRHWSTEDVFQFLQRAGTSPAVPMSDGLSLPSFMKSNRLLLKIYGDSAKDTCEINIGEHRSGRAGCGGSARNGCHQCFKAGTIDRAATAQNDYTRWSSIQSNAIKVRDFVFSIAHNIRYRTMHPRSFDPITGHAVLQPNILNSRTLEKMLWLYTQLSFDDWQRSNRARELSVQGRMLDDPGYAEIATDFSMDDDTRHEYLTMYETGSQRHLINMVSLEHAVFLSAQWAMDGVKSAPYRPLAIYDAVFNQGKRIPYPAPRPLVVDSIPDAMTIPLTDVHHPGSSLWALWQRPSRPWDAANRDHQHGCMEESTTAAVRVRVEYNRDADQLKVTCQGSILNVGPATRLSLTQTALARLAPEESITRFSTSLTQRSWIVAAERLSDKQKTPVKLQQFTRRVSKVDKKTGRISRERTSLMMYPSQSTPSLESSWTSTVELWVPEFTRTSFPYIAQHQATIEEASPSYAIHPLALSEWRCSGGYDAALSAHHHFIRHLKRTRHRVAGRMSLRAFTGPDAFWSLMQAGVLSVDQKAWNTCQTTLKRTELFAAAGLFALPDQSHDIARLHSHCYTMTEHRALKARALLSIREQRNQRRHILRTRLHQRETTPGDFFLHDITLRMDRLHALRASITGTQYLDDLFLSALRLDVSDEAVTSPSERVRLRDEWSAEYADVFQSPRAFLQMFGSHAERALLKTEGALVLSLDQHLRQLNRAFYETMNTYALAWTAYTNTMHNTHIERPVFHCPLFTASILEQGEQLSRLIPSVGRVHGDISARLARIECETTAVPSPHPPYRPSAFFNQVWSDVVLAHVRAAHHVRYLQKIADHSCSISTMTGGAKAHALLSMLKKKMATDAAILEG